MSFWAGLGGFLLVPIAGTVATRVVTAVLPTPSTDEKKMNQALAVAGAAYVTTAVVAYSAAKRRGLSKGEKTFARGGMWGSAVAAAFVPAGYVLNEMAKNQPPRVAGTLTSGDVRGMLDTLTGGSINASRFAG